jgi:hypothetical protein
MLRYHALSRTSGSGRPAAGEIGSGALHKHGVPECNDEEKHQLARYVQKKHTYTNKG